MYFQQIQVRLKLSLYLQVMEMQTILSLQTATQTGVAFPLNQATDTTGAHCTTHPNSSTVSKTVCLSSQGLTGCVVDVPTLDGRLISIPINDIIK